MTAFETGFLNNFSLFLQSFLYENTFKSRDQPSGSKQVIQTEQLSLSVAERKQKVMFFEFI